MNTQSLIDSLKSTEEKLAAALAEVCSLTHYSCLCFKNAKLLEAKKKYEEKTVDCDTTHEIISVLKEVSVILYLYLNCICLGSVGSHSSVG